MALLALGATIEGSHDYQILDGNLTADAPRALLDLIEPHSNVVVAVTVMGGPQLVHAVEASRVVKTARPDATVIWGGYFPTQHPETCLRESYVDFVLRGHGDEVFPGLIRAVCTGDDGCDDGCDGGDLSGMPGVVSKGAAAGTTMPAVPDPNILQDFPYHRIPVERYIRPTFMGRRTLPHHSSYGCPFTCNFCAVVNMASGRWKAQSAERTAETVRRLVRDYRLDAVEFYDNNFFVSEKRTAEFADRIQDLDIRWWGEARIDTLMKYDDSTWRRMKESGLKMVFLGAESGSDETLRRMNKGGTATAEKTLEIAEKMRRLGIVPEFSFVLGNPPDPERDVDETITFIRRLKRVNPEAELVLYMYTPVPLAGDLLDGASASGFKFAETIDEWINLDWQHFAGRRGYGLPWIGDSVRRRVRDFERVVNAYHPTITDPNLSGLRRSLLKMLGAWRYHTEFYNLPIELHALQRLFRYQRPETAGF